jgi:[ribosomal protein S5]-alanine N-acetyltransferase
MKSRIALARLSTEDAREFLAASRRSHALHRPWVAPPETPAAFKLYIARMHQPGNHAFTLRRRDTGALVGFAAVTNIIMGAFRSGYLGYYGFAPHARQGFMREGVGEVVRYAFRTLKLHRIEANVQPKNRASRALIESLGFRQEGFSPRYLKIGGRWRDHERWALLAKR